MNNAVPGNTVLFLGDFLDYLRHNGFSIGVDRLLRAQLLLARLGVDFEPEQLKEVLCPLFAASDEEQKRFYQLFDDYVNTIEQSAPVRGEKPQPKSRKRERRTLAIVSVFIVLLAAALFFFSRTGEHGGKTNLSTPTVEPSPSPSPSVTTGLSTPGPAETIQGPPSTPTPPPATPNQSPPSPPAQSIAGKNYLAIFAAGAFLFLLLELAGYLKNKLRLRRQRHLKPPFSWSLRVEAQKPKLYQSREFYQAIRRLRRRRIAEYHRLNIAATISATIRSLGYPTFRYSPDSTIPEYLMLIDRVSSRDHQSQLFNELFKALKREGLYVTRYFYEGNPSRCSDEAGKKFFHLSELSAKHLDHRLLICGDGAELIGAITGRLSEWVKVFSSWHDRVIVTPVSPAQWGSREVLLSGQFAVVPANLDGLVKLAARFDPPLNRELGSWTYDETDRLLPDIRAANVRTLLRSYLGKDVFQWVCACAVFSEVQWDLTLKIGALPCMAANLVYEDALLRIARLPWFRDGRIPDDVRWELVTALDRDKHDAVRTLAIDLLSKDAPPADTFAGDTHALELVLHEWLIGKKRAWKRLREAMRRIPRDEILADRVHTRYLREVPNSPLTKFVPLGWRRLLYKDGMPHLGLRSAVRLLSVLLLATLISVGIHAGVIPPPLGRGPAPAPTSTPSPLPGRPSPELLPSPSTSPSPSSTVSPTPPAATPTPINLSSETIILPCPPGTTSSRCNASPSQQVRLSVGRTFRPANQSTYNWVIEVGRIRGTGPTVTWDLKGVAPGTYEAAVSLDDGSAVFQSVTIEMCSCLPGCPTISVSCPESANAGTLLTFNAITANGFQGKYDWTISAGRILAGQGSAMLSVDTTGFGGKMITATVDAMDIPSQCTRTASCTTVIPTLRPTPWPTQTPALTPTPDSTSLPFLTQVIVHRETSSEVQRGMMLTVEFLSVPQGATVYIVPKFNAVSGSSSLQQYRLSTHTNTITKLAAGIYEVTFELKGKRITKTVDVK